MAEETGECEALKLSNQVCFPLYACSKELVRQYGPYLKELNLTYTQYIVMMVLWEKESVSSRELAECLRAVRLIAAQENLSGGYRVVSNCGADACQSVPHLHFHILGGAALTDRMG